MPEYQTVEEFAEYVLSECRGTLGALLVRLGPEHDVTQRIDRVINRSAEIIKRSEMRDGQAAVETLDLSTLPPPSEEDDPE